MLKTEFLNGMRVVTTNMITNNVRARTHKKKRIDKKWLKRYWLRTVLDNTNAYIVNGAIFMTKSCYERLKKQIENGGNTDDFMRFQKVYEKLTRKWVRAWQINMNYGN